MERDAQLRIAIPSEWICQAVRLVQSRVEHSESPAAASVKLYQRANSSPVLSTLPCIGAESENALCKILHNSEDNLRAQPISTQHGVVNGMVSILAVLEHDAESNEMATCSTPESFRLDSHQVMCV